MKRSPIIVIAIVALLLSPLLLMIDRSETKTNSSASSASPSASASASATNKPADAVTAKKVVLKTSKGDININLYKDETPKAVMNFVTLGQRGYYNNVIFHRIIQDFMIQSGDPTGTGTGGQSIYGSSFGVEQNAGHKFKAGSLGMANTGQPNSNGSQFFIMTAAEYPSLDGGYTLFGEVADDASMQVVKAIAAVPVTAQPGAAETSRPVDEQSVKITGFSILE